jgi:hypothetical protein
MWRAAASAARQLSKVAQAMATGDGQPAQLARTDNPVDSGGSGSELVATPLVRVRAVYGFLTVVAIDVSKSPRYVPFE